MEGTVVEDRKREYNVIEYVETNTEVVAMSVADYVQKDNMPAIVAKLQEIIDTEAPITHEKLIKKCLRAFGIGRSSAATLEVTEKAIKKTVLKSNKQNGTKFYWRLDQELEKYSIYRNDTNNMERRLPEEICQQEVKNAVCCTLAENVSMAKEDLVKETIRTMGYSRRGSALEEAVDRGIKYGLKTGELVRNGDKTISRSVS